MPKKRKAKPKPKRQPAKRQPAKRQPREDFNQAAFRVVQQATK